MTTIILKDADLRKAAEEGMDAFVDVFIKAIKDGIGGELNAENMPLLNADQITLLAWDILHTEVMDGGLIQLIHNGYGPFIWINPTSKAFREWGIADLCSWLRRSEKLFKKYREELTRDCTDEEFMALFEKYPEFDTFDDEFVEREEEWTAQVAAYIDDHIDNFGTIA
ncbi:MAG: DMP19 family protein [Prevotella sp.]|uniref:DMP19 family protein n=1 Tax=Prevotella sp. AGR2160 TaxID=1280674 RepID=UPI00041FEE34|nr:DMP19 family protein [Prevotella sp. AGR2160]MDD5861585.1 DMP19 family protein [Prevotella sp.]